MMEILVFAFALSIPIFYVYGIYQFLKRNNASPNSVLERERFEEFWKVGIQDAKEELYREFLTASEQAETETDKAAYRIAAEFLAEKYHLQQLEPIDFSRIGGDNKIGFRYVVSKAPDELHFSELLKPHADTVSNHDTFSSHLPPTPLPVPPARAPQLPISPFHALENINILLYLGAFFVIVASGIFASYSYGALTGVTKTVLMGVFASVFYGSGLVMYQRSKNIRPAAVVFTAIGLLTFPLVGLVAYHFWFEDNQVRVVWFATSLVCIVVYFLAYRVIRHGLLEYLSIFTALSFFQSTIGLFNVSVPYYYWGFSVFALGSMLIEKKVYHKVEASPLQFTAQFLLPLSVVLSLVSVAQPYYQAGVTLGIATVYYGLLASLTEKQDERKLYSLLSGTALPVAVVLFLMELTPRLSSPTIQFGIIGVSILYSAMTEHFIRKESPQLTSIFAGLACVLALIACGLTVKIHILNLVTVVSSVVICFFHLYRLRKIPLYIAYAIALYVLPYTIWHVLLQRGQWVFLAALYLSLLGAFFATRKLTLSLTNGLLILVLSYVAACLTAFGFAMHSQEPSRDSMLLIIALVVIGLSYLHLYQMGTQAFYAGFVIGLFCLPLAISALMPQMGQGVFIAALYLILVGAFFVNKTLILSLDDGLPMFIGSYVIFCLASAFFAINSHESSSGTMKLAITLVVIGLSYLHLYQMGTRAFYVGFVIGLFCLPLAISAVMPQMGQGVFIAALYLILVGAFFVNKTLIQSLKDGRVMLIGSYAIFCFFSLGVAAISDEPASVIMILAVSAVILALSLNEQIPQVTFIPFMLIYYVIVRARLLFLTTDIQTSVLLSVAGVIFYALSIRAPADRKNHLIVLGILGPFLGLIPFGTPIIMNPLYSLPSAVGGSIATLEGVRRRSPIICKVGVAIVLAAIHYFTYQVLKISEVQFYTLSWAAYLFWLSRWASKDEEDFYLLGVLSLVTIPLAFQALQDQTRAFMLIIESLALVIAGIQFRRALVWRWGVGVLVIEVLYYMRDFFLTLPTWAIFGTVGLALLGGAIFLLQRRTQSR